MAYLMIWQRKDQKFKVAESHEYKETDKFPLVVSEIKYLNKLMQ